MTNAKPTPGPWRVEEGTTLVWGECNAGDATNYGMGYPIAECQITPSGKWAKGPRADEGAANARLIAAAPDLLEALEDAVSHYGRPGGPWNVLEGPGAWITKARAAIVKARGGAA